MFNREAVVLLKDLNSPPNPASVLEQPQPISIQPTSNHFQPISDHFQLQSIPDYFQPSTSEHLTPLRPMAVHPSPIRPMTAPPLPPPSTPVPNTSFSSAPELELAAQKDTEELIQIIPKPPKAQPKSQPKSKKPKKKAGRPPANPKSSILRPLKRVNYNENIPRSDTPGAKIRREPEPEGIWMNITSCSFWHTSNDVRKKTVFVYPNTLFYMSSGNIYLVFQNTHEWSTIPKDALVKITHLYHRTSLGLEHLEDLPRLFFAVFEDIIPLFHLNRYIPFVTLKDWRPEDCFVAVNTPPLSMKGICLIIDNESYRPQYTSPRFWENFQKIAFTHDEQLRQHLNFHQNMVEKYTSHFYLNFKSIPLFLRKSAFGGLVFDQVEMYMSYVRNYDTSYLSKNIAITGDIFEKIGDMTEKNTHARRLVIYDVTGTDLNGHAEALTKFTNLEEIIFLVDGPCNMIVMMDIPFVIGNMYVKSTILASEEPIIRIGSTTMKVDLDDFQKKSRFKINYLFPSRFYTTLLYFVLMNGIETVEELKYLYM